MAAYNTNSDAAGSSNFGELSVFVDTNSGAYDFVAIGIVHDQAVTGVPSGLTLRDSASAGGWMWSFYTGSAASVTLPGVFFFAAEVHAVAVSLAFETDHGGTLYDGNGAHSIDMHAVTGDTADEDFSSVEGWPFVWSWVTGSGGFADAVTYFTPLRAQADRSDEWLVLHGPEDCAGFPTTWPFEWTLDTGRSFRRVSFLDLAAPSVDRPEGCTIPDPPVTARWALGKTI